MSSTSQQLGTDPAARQRVSTVTALGEYTLDLDRTYLWDTEVDGATATYSATDGAYVLTLDGNAADEYAIAQTKQVHTYFPGKPQQFEPTFVDLTPVTGAIKRVGYFSSSFVAPYTANLDGLFLEASAGTHFMCVYRDGVVTAKIPRDEWIDKMDGKGPSGKTIDFANFNVPMMDFLFLGGTTVRLAFRIDGEWVYAHRYHHASTLPGTMIRHPAQPLRYEIRSTAAVAASLKVVCGQVSTEGAVNRIGIDRSLHMGAASINANVAGTWYALKGVTLKSGYRHSQAFASSLSVQGLTVTDRFMVGLFYDPTVAGTFTYSDVARSGLREATGDTVSPASATTVTGGDLLFSRYVDDSASIDVELRNTLESVGFRIDGTPIPLVLAVMPMSANLDVRGSLGMTEFI